MKRTDVIDKVARNVREQIETLRCDSVIRTISDLQAEIKFDHLELTNEEITLLGEKYLENIQNDLSRFIRFCADNDIDCSRWKSI